MKIQLVSPFWFRWVQHYADLARARGHEFVATKRPQDRGADVEIYAWCDVATVEALEFKPKGKRIVFLRAYEFYEYGWQNVDWGRVDAVFVVNDHIGRLFHSATGIVPEVVYNAVDPSRWAYRDRGPGHKIALVAAVHYKKNHALALEILSRLPLEYELHCAGEVQCPDVMEYLDQLARELQRTLYFHGRIEDMDAWLEDKDYILSTSFREGSPNNVLEAMAKGIKPVVMAWPGAREQFPEACSTVGEAVGQILSKDYESSLYLERVNEKFSLDNYARVISKAEEIHGS